MGYRCEIEVLSQSLVVRNMDNRSKRAMADVLYELVEYKLTRVPGGPGKKAKFKKEADKTYAYANPDKSVIKIPRSLLNKLIERLKEYHVKRRKINIIHRGKYKAEPLNLTMPSGFTPRDYQEKAALEINDEGMSKFINFPMGKGKTKTALYAAVLYNEKLVVQVLARYYKKWMNDLVENYQIGLEQMLLIDDFKSLAAVMQQIHSGFMPEFKVMLVTTSILINYITMYHTTEPKYRPEWLIEPDRLYEILGIGYRIVDEVHQHFYANVMIDLNMHVNKTIFLTATLIGQTSFLSKIYDTIYPRDIWCSSIPFSKYFVVKAIKYHIKRKDKIRCTLAGSYNQNEFEKWLMSNKTELFNYLTLIKYFVDEYFYKVKKDGEKTLIFAGTVDMCIKIRDFLLTYYPTSTICKYNSGDKLDDVLTSDITVSTLGKSGTALDIPKLRYVLQTVALDKQDTSLQAIGRLREPTPQDGYEAVFHYLVCASIDKHVYYHESKYELFRPLVKEHSTTYYHLNI